MGICSNWLQLAPRAFLGNGNKFNPHLDISQTQHWDQQQGNYRYVQTHLNIMQFAES